ncbi:MAG TPA: hypothetical protein EYQ29_13155 [Candidatus Lambdaproteobacteria bacterium]|nr:hypothetical protein [Candidatus Lambdaproteobacteria bacterium]
MECVEMLPEDTITVCGSTIVRIRRGKPLHFQRTQQPWGQQVCIASGDFLKAVAQQGHERPGYLANRFGGADQNTPR